MNMKKLFLPFLLAFLLTACTQNTKTGNNSSTNENTSVDTAMYKVANVNEQAIYSRAFNAVIWGMAAVNSELMHQSLIPVKGDYNQLVYWSGLINSKNQTL